MKYAYDGPVCKKCGAPLVRRQAKKGPYAGEWFLGCSKYPECKYTQRIASEVAGRKWAKGSFGYNGSSDKRTRFSSEPGLVNKRPAGKTTK
jgi:ssDNA-binding Zn-finger/Zn-ribbon topoisomerase 1